MLKSSKVRSLSFTRGTEGIGLATAKLFRQRGCLVSSPARRQKELDDAVKEIGSNAFWRFRETLPNWADLIVLQDRL